MLATFSLLKTFINQCKIILELAKDDLKIRFSGSFLGIFWAILMPVINIAVFLFVFDSGFRSTPLEGVPFSVWFLCGMVPWFYISEGWIVGTNSVFDYSYLIKKMEFNISFIPLIKIVSALFIHLFFLAVLVAVVVNNLGWNPIYFELFYYLFCTFTLVFSLSYLTAAISPFFPDMKQILQAGIQILFYLTPIFWDYKTLFPDIAIQNALKINPFLYIVEGYRDIFIRGGHFWENSGTGLFWLQTLTLLVVSMFLFSRVKEHFADVL